MSNKNADILQVEKYLAGKLDARAMHELERKALADPLLYDALEGHSKAGMTSANLDDLNTRLQQRIAPPKVRMLNFTVLAMAASVLMVLTLGGIWLFNKNTPEQQSVAMADKTSVTPSPLTKSPEISINNDSLLALNTPATTFSKPQSHRSLSKPTKLSSDPSLARVNDAPLAFTIETDEGHHAPAPTMDNRDSVPLDELLVMGMNKAKKADMPASNSNITSRLAGVRARQSAEDKVISGKVVSGQDGAPLPGVSISVSGHPTIIQTDANGVFKIPGDSAANLKLNYVGFESRSLKVQPGTSPDVIAMEPANSSLNEVVVTGYGVSKKRKTTAQPKEGWERYQEYLNANAVSPDGKEITVRVDFSVSADGSFSDFKTSAERNTLLQQQAIELVKNGPRWIGNSNGKLQKASVKIKFRKAG